MESPKESVKPANLVVLTQPLYGVTKSGPEQPQVQLKDTRDQVLSRLAEFGGLSNLIHSDEKYNVYLSKGLWELFCAKYNELIVK